MGRVRAKFRLNSYQTSLQTVGYEKDADGKDVYAKPIKEEMRTLNFTPVGAGPGASEEDKMFWRSSPSGSLQMGTVNKAAWEYFELEQDYYLDFTKVEH